MHRISNAKLNKVEKEKPEWWLYDSCDGPTCGPDRGTTTTTTTTTTTPAVSDECKEAQKVLEAEENSLAKMTLVEGCKAACVNDPQAKCGFLVNGVSMILVAILAMLK